jgi:hypothetical protein
LDRPSGGAEDRPEVNMGSVGPTQLIALLVAVAVIAATSGFLASTVALKKKRARKFFALGFLCGFVASPIMLRKRRGMNVLGAVARCADVLGSAGSSAVRTRRI